MRTLLVSLSLLLGLTAWAVPTPFKDRNPRLYTVLLRDPQRCVDAQRLLARYHFSSRCSTSDPDDEIRVLSAEFFGKSIDAAVARLSRDRAVQSVQPTRHFPRAN